MPLESDSKWEAGGPQDRKQSSFSYLLDTELRAGLHRPGWPLPLFRPPRGPETNFLLRRGRPSTLPSCWASIRRLLLLGGAMKATFQLRVCRGLLCAPLIPFAPH